MRRLLWILGAIAAVVVLLIVSALVLLPRPRLGAQATTNSTRVQRIDVNQTVESSGNIAAERTALLAFGINGTVAEVAVSVGDSVRTGQALASLLTDDLTLQVQLRVEALRVAQSTLDDLLADPSARDLAQAQASVANAQVQVATAQNNITNAPNQILQSCASLATLEQALQDAQTAYQDYVEDGARKDAGFVADPNAAASDALSTAQRNYDNGLAQCSITTTNSQTSPVQLTSAEAALVSAQAALDELLAGPEAPAVLRAQSQVTQAQLQLQQAQLDLAQATISAPFDGVVTAVEIVQGQTVNSTTIVIQMADLQRLYLSVDVDELDVLSLAVGQSAQITLEALDGQQIPGMVTRIAPAADTNQGTVTYNVRVNITMDGQATTVATPPAQPASLLPLPDGIQPPAFDATALLEALGGVEGLQALSSAPDGDQQLATALRELGVPDPLIERIGSVERLIAFLNTQGIEVVVNDVPAVVTSTNVSAIPLRIGMTADVEIIIGTAVGVLAVPTNFIQRQGTSEYVIIQNGDQTLNVPITSGLTEGELTVVTGDLTEGQTLVLPAPAEQPGFSLVPRAPNQ
jgi:HlyD family secretion protein